MKEFKRYSKSTKRSLIKLYVLNCKLKETYNECQYYISPSELKIFYEESFFNKSNFCSTMNDAFMNEHKLQLFKSQIEVSFYITMLTFKLYLQGDKSAYLFKKALKLEEKSTFVVASLIKEDVSPTLHKELTHHFHMQEKRIIALKNIIKNHYDALPQES